MTFTGAVHMAPGSGHWLGATLPPQGHWTSVLEVRTEVCGSCALPVAPGFRVWGTTLSLKQVWTEPGWEQNWGSIAALTP